MPKIPTIFEQELRNQAPTRFDGAFLDRLTACAEGSLADMPKEDVEFAAIISSIKPRAISSALNSSLMNTIGETPFAVDEKIVMFNRQAKPGIARPRIFRHFNIAAAAAVALLGALTAFMIPGGKNNENGNFQASNSNHVSTIPATNPHLAPASFGHNLSETRDAGVIWRGKNQPHRVIRLTYADMVTMKNEKGESYQVERPRYEYVIIPEKID